MVHIGKLSPTLLFQRSNSYCTLSLRNTSTLNQIKEYNICVMALTASYHDLDSFLCLVIPHCCVQIQILHGHSSPCRKIDGESSLKAFKLQTTHKPPPDELRPWSSLEWLFHETNMPQCFSRSLSISYKTESKYLAFRTAGEDSLKQSLSVIKKRRK